MDQEYAAEENLKADRPMTQVERAESELQKEQVQLSEVISHLRAKLKKVTRLEIEQVEDVPPEQRERIGNALETMAYNTPLASSLGETAKRIRNNRRELEKIISYLEV